MTIIAHKCHGGIDCIDDILKHVYGISKADPDPLTEEGFLVFIGRLIKKIYGAVFPYEEKRYDRAIRSLARRAWDRLTTREQDTAIEKAAGLLPNPDQTARLVTPIIRSEGAVLTRLTRQSAIRTHGLSIGADMALTDTAVADYIASSQSFFVTHAARGRNALWSQKAREIVSEGVMQGLGRAEIATDLEAAIGSARMLGRSRGYYETIASTYMSHGRSWAHLTSFADAGIQRFQFEAVMDQRTSEQCRFYDSQVFTVSSARDRYIALSQSPDPDAIEDLMPWVRTRRNIEGQQELYVRYRNGAETTLATVTRSAMGQVDQRGSYSGALPASQLEAIGCPVPPLHGRCRSTIQPIF
jgi:hypothetical protein